MPLQYLTLLLSDPATERPAYLLFHKDPVRDAEEGKEKLRHLALECGIIYITEALAAELPEEIERYKEQVMPAIIQIPGVSGNTGAGVEGVKKTVEQAVGSDILFSQE